MIDAYYWPTPNGWKLSIALEEMELDYRVVPVNIGRGDQFKEDYLKISPNNRMPAIVDHDPSGGGDPISVFESGAILVYLAEKTEKFIPSNIRGRTEVLEWLMWQMGGMGPMFGQNGHFRFYAPEQIPYAQERYNTESLRLIDLAQFPNVRRWYDLLKTRPGLRRGYQVGQEFGKPDGKWDEEARKNLMAHTR